jgi:mannose-6-phosphate isomerase-like protein (cupin superfamily)
LLVRNLAECAEFIAGDGTLLRELLHPDKDQVSLRYSIARAIVPPRMSSLPHQLASSEVYYILSGSGTMHIDSESSPVSPDHLVYIPPGAVQFIDNTSPEPLVFLCIVDPAWRAEDEKILA